MALAKMRTILSLLFLALVLCTVLGSDVGKPNQVSRMKIPQLKKCPTNVCFALDGSVTLQSWQFQLQKNFVLRVVSALKPFSSANVAGVQYGLDNLVISPLTNDKVSFFDAVNDSTFSAVNATFISGGISYCIRQLRNLPKENNRMVVLGSGMADFGGDPVLTAEQFNGEIFSVEVGSDTDRKALIAIAGGKKKNVFTLTRGRDVVPTIVSFLPRLCAT